ncbi:MAG TPA: hemerythrin domain-containing protein [Anaeromyxobacter sp.]|nr:hemerythrin domain-containing protein [Anaeromyxobacter sp.]
MIDASTAGPIARYLSEDHVRLERLLSASVAGAGFSREPFDAFRAGLLRHIALEEKILFRALREAGSDEAALALLRRLRIDHGALASLLVGTPASPLVAEIRIVLAPHNALEDAPGGLYDRCDALLAARAAEILEQMRSYPPVKAAAYADGPRVLRTAHDALAASARQHGIP